MTTGDQSQYAVVSAQFKAVFNQGVETISFTAKDQNLITWPTREAYTSRSAIIQVAGKETDNFIFILPNELQIQTYLQQINGRAADPTIKHEIQQGDDVLKLLCGHIPKAGIQ